ncbi:MAG: SMC-Scp complex subunit ScpB, partial [Candidatus Omnitrophota bacterium]
LLEKSLIRISGRKQIPGKPFFYSTSKPFLEFFGLQSLAELPRLEEFESVGIELRNVSEPGREEEKGFLKDDGTVEIGTVSGNTSAYRQDQAAEEIPGGSNDDLARQNGGEEDGEAGGITQENRPD